MSSDMTSLVGSNNNLSTDYYLRKFYEHNREVSKASKRSDYTNNELIYEDTIALKKAAKMLSSFEYKENNDDKNIYNSIRAFVTTYNNAITSSGKVNDPNLKRQVKNLMKVTDKYSDALKNIGLEIKDDGTINIKDGILSKASLSDISKAFSKETGYMNASTISAKRINERTYNILYNQILGRGLHLDITL
ncbi:hypothetical protein [Lachnobacterium bovis]|uniref:Flagellar hook-associated protein 2 C-terminus n=1 Tax=Lachnobacterium bovis TaxID=140626 RepID=A0A1H9RV91_9FIRM|nr:hypothetical protein [Lachnobacterium bovis]SER76712.1 hypothetical protein SAMN02910429_01030 [Lachnobacterium bovis]